jgi:hypothetical protein
MKKLIVFFELLAVAMLLSSCGISSPILQYSESKSNFKNPPELIDNNYPAKDIYRIYHRASSGFTPMQKIREAAEQRINKFAQQQGKSFIVLGEKMSMPPYILGNFQRIEIVFALFDKAEKPINTTPKLDKFSKLEKLKKLLDDGALTKEEYEKEKKKVLEEE